MWDLALDLASSDLIFGGNHDLLGVSGPELVNQRILARCRIPRGSYKGDEDESLGSDLYLLPSFSTPVQVHEAEASVRAALEAMDDIEVSEVEVSVTELNQLLIRVKWSPATSLNEPPENTVEPEPVFETQVTF